MKLEDIKATIDSYFDNVSEQEFYELLVDKYHMPVVYDIDMKPITIDNGGNVLCGLDDIRYDSVFSGDAFVNKVTKIDSADSSCGTMSFCA